MSVLLENTAVYRGGSIAKPRSGVARLLDDRIEIVSNDGQAIATIPLADIRKVKASGAAVMLKGETFKSASVEFMATRTKILLAVCGLVPMLIAMYAGKGRKTAVAWTAKLDELRARPGSPEATPAQNG